ncbi:helix-turn-helix domain-containing protein [Lysinimonas soli]|uniref:Helix-turn-helix domain-containing protein n=1 Tax=Lysinimonas soli TaxID=1074233 RepID=A0ABW0NT14_9MICO
MRRAGGEVRKQAPSDGVLAEAARLYQEGTSLQQLADQLGVPKSTLRRKLSESGVVMGRPSSRTVLIIETDPLQRQQELPHIRV